MNITDENLEVAYRKLKRLVYYDKTDLNLRRRLATFECDATFMKKLNTIKKCINSDDPLQEPSFKGWLKDIGCRVVPKGFKKDHTLIGNEATEGRFISNVTSAKYLNVERVNYFFDGPIELHLIAVLWIMLEGRMLDSQLGEECYGARLEDGLSKADDRSAGLFRKYHELYARWRDSGIRKARQLLTDERTNVCILGLDIQEYYYHIQLDFQEIARAVHLAGVEETDESAEEAVPSNLLKYLEAICVAYQKKIHPFLQLTHENVPPFDIGLPIGLCSSPLLANWYLRNFDKAIKKRVRPAYYGRYVDDILLVVTAPEDHSREKHPVAAFMDQILVQAGILHKPVDNRYEIAKNRGLFFQQGKCILQYFDVKHSIAGLQKFQKKLEENGSEFLLMPVDEADSSLEDVAYELLYEGSVNKFRNVKGMAENRYELAKHLARQTILHLLTDDPPDPKISLGLRNFFRGKNAIEFHDLWERVFTFFVIAGDLKAVTAFTKYLHSEIKRLRYARQQSITDHLINNLEKHLMLCIAMSGALGDSVLELDEADEDLNEAFRTANLIRHHFVRLPLLNYTTYSGALNTRTVKTRVKVDPHKIALSPRYVNFDECQLLADSGYVKRGGLTAFHLARDIYKTINSLDVEDIEWNSISLLEEDADA